MFAVLNVFAIVSLFACSAWAGPVTIRSESHTVSFVNNCGSGTPQLLQGGVVLSSGEAFTSNRPFEAAIAYLQTGPCLLNGEECTTVEMTLVNPTVPGGGSSVDVTLIAPHAFNVGAGFSYSDSTCGGQTCADAGCTEAFHNPTDFSAQTQCETDNVGLTITFC
ncbi:hypothetical protein BT96DRAFT_989086 [Gymnopus androsaceus JB14]|uniref:Glycopeptide n=1 Tax=Gymnopus androsaceus JB14 TaxID=1447944 RepID=A0A6A4I7V0_9AGAR|nr:hypothetical protein BT96DRAFT_989086 [Gymnopus androsaceus JB14]